jgi:hypothetical protein
MTIAPGDSAIFPSRFRGPAGSANGGYACGVVAGLVNHPVVEVTLRAPPPLDTRIPVERLEGNQVLLKLEGNVVAAGKPAELDMSPPAAPSFEQAHAASHPAGAERPNAYAHHVMPECFVCGITRDCGDSLCLWPGPFGDRGHIATTWIPNDSVCDASGAVLSEVVWSALDCPTGLVFMFTEKTGTFMVLGRMTARISKPLRRGEQYIQLGWPIGNEARKFFGGSALFAASGELCAMAKATWIRVP